MFLTISLRTRRAAESRTSASTWVRKSTKLWFCPGVDAIPIGVLRRLHEFYEAGGTVIMVGPGQRMDTNGAMTRVQLVPATADPLHRRPARRGGQGTRGPPLG